MATRTITQVFYAVGTTTFVVPVGVTSVTVDVVGGGGNGGSGTGWWNNYHWDEGWGAGGTKGSRAQTTVSVTPGQSITVVVGGGGQSSAFGAVSAGHGYNGAANQNGEAGYNINVGGFYGTDKQSDDGWVKNWSNNGFDHNGGVGGNGWSAGGGAGHGGDPYGSMAPGGAGAPGYVTVTWTGTDFDQTGNLAYTTFHTPGTYTFTVPNNVNYMIVELSGAGGGGGAAVTGGTPGSGGYERSGLGGRQGKYKALGLTVSPGQTYTIVIGSKGQGGARNSGSAGTSGGNSTFGNVTIGTTTCAGGAGGPGVPSGGQVHGDGQFSDVLDTDLPSGNNAPPVGQGYGDYLYGLGGIDGGGDGGMAGTGDSGSDGWGWNGGNGGAGPGAGGGGGGSATVGPPYYAGGGAGGNGSDGWCRITWGGWDNIRPVYSGTMRIKTSSGNIDVGLVLPGAAHLQYQCLRIRKGGTTYCLDLVPYDNPQASGFRIQTKYGVLATRKTSGFP